MHLLRERDAEVVRGRLAALTQPLRLLEDVVSCSGQVTLEVHDRISDPASSTAYGVDRVPAIVVLGARDYGIRYYGLPAGYELATLLDIIVDAGRGTADLEAATRAAVAQLPADVHLRVFVTPT